MEQTVQVRIYYEDTDAGGIVYHANYLKYCERGRTEFLRTLGVEQDTLLEDNIAFVVKSMTIDFIRPAKFNELLTVTSSITRIARASVEFSQSIENCQGLTVFTAKVQVVCVGIDTMKPRSIPIQVKEVLERAS